MARREEQARLRGAVLLEPEGRLRPRLPSRRLHLRGNRNAVVTWEDDRNLSDSFPGPVLQWQGLRTRRAHSSRRSPGRRLLVRGETRPAEPSRGLRRTQAGLHSRRKAEASSIPSPYPVLGGIGRHPVTWVFAHRIILLKLGVFRRRRLTWPRQFSWSSVSTSHKLPSFTRTWYTIREVCSSIKSASTKSISGTKAERTQKRPRPRTWTCSGTSRPRTRPGRPTPDPKCSERRKSRKTWRFSSPGIEASSAWKSSSRFSVSTRSRFEASSLRQVFRKGTIRLSFQDRLTFKISDLMAGVRTNFRKTGDFERLCLYFLKACSTGPSHVVRELLCSRLLSESLMDSRGNSCVMFAAVSRAEGCVSGDDRDPAFFPGSGPARDYRDSSRLRCRRECLQWRKPDAAELVPPAKAGSNGIARELGGIFRFSRLRPHRRWDSPISLPVSEDELAFLF